MRYVTYTLLKLRHNHIRLTNERPMSNCLFCLPMCIIAFIYDRMYILVLLASYDDQISWSRCVISKVRFAECL